MTTWPEVGSSVQLSESGGGYATHELAAATSRTWPELSKVTQ